MKEFAVFQIFVWLNTTNAAILPLVAGGRSTNITNYNYIAALESKQDNDFFCGAVIIGPDVVLTAAHCLDKVTADNLTVVAGQTDNIDSSGFSVSSYQIHPEYRTEPYSNDIAVIYMKEHFSFNRSVGKAKLPSSPRAKDFIEKNLTVVGWGSDETTTRTSTLHVATMLGKDPNICKTHYGVHFTPESMICAGGDGTASCSGDSGGPLVETASGTVVGLVSYGPHGIECGQQESVYVMLSSYLGWIKNLIQKINQSISECEGMMDDLPAECEVNLFNLDCGDFDCFGDCSFDQCES